eukprot:6472387-Amphidinium_carterae.2
MAQSKGVRAGDMRASATGVDLARGPGCSASAGTGRRRGLAQLDWTNVEPRAAGAGTGLDERPGSSRGAPGTELSWCWDLLGPVG